MFFKKNFSSLEELLTISKKQVEKEGYNLVHLCVLHNKPSFIDEIEDRKYLITQKNAWGFTPIHLAIYLNRKKCLARLGFTTNKKITIEKEGTIEDLTVNQFEKKMGIEYLPNLEIPNVKEMKKLLAFNKKAKKKKWVNHEEKWLGTYFQTEIQYDLNPNIVVKWVDPIKGYGLFANQTLKKKQWIGQYTGELRKAHFKKDQKNAYCFEYCPHSNLTIDAKEKGNLTRFINHSYVPNLTPTLVFSTCFLHIVFLTNRTIEKGEELTYDYGPDYWKKRENPIF